MKSILFACAGALLITAVNAAPFPSSQTVPNATSSASAYQDVSAATKCSLSTESCAAFSAITGSRVLILHVSCSFTLKSGSTIEIAGIGIKNNRVGAASNLFAVTKTADVSGGSFYVIDRQTYLFVDRGDTPEVAVVSTNKPAENLQCSISGMHA